ncbi:MAG: antitoxin Xre/MbcA/ParS toxin-binding domain-containing protein [Bacteroidota bacterium]
MTEKKYSIDNSKTPTVSELYSVYEATIPSSLELIEQLLGGVKTIGKKINNILEFLQLAQHGLPISVLKSLQKRMKFTNREMGKVLEISESTLQRRIKKGEKLDKRESENTIQLAALWAKGLEVFDNEYDFRRWLDMENIALGNNKPLDILHSSIGRDEIKELLTRIEWGIYS